MDVTSQLSQFVFNQQFADIPAPVVHEAKRSLINFFATALAGSHEPAIEKSLLVANSLTTERSSPIIGRLEKTDICTSAFLNAMSANVFDYDDTHEPTVIHPSAPVFPAILALAERQKINGEELLLAFILGADIECRIGNAVSPGHYRRGWHITSTCGVFGSAIASGKILGLSTQQLTWALGNASAQSSGLIETLGTMAKSISVGNAAKNGLLAALLAKNDFFGPDQVLEGQYGFLKVYNNDYDISELSSDLGSRWELLRNSYKPYPCGVVLNPVIEASVGLSKKITGKLDNIKSIQIKGHPLIRERTDRASPRTSQEAQVSAQHCVAVALTYGEVTLQQCTQQHFGAPSLKALGAKVMFIDAADMVMGSATVSILFTDGTLETMHIQEAKGSTKNPLSDRDLESKLENLGRYGSPRVITKNLASEIWNIESCQDVSALIRAAQPTA